MNTKDLFDAIRGYEGDPRPIILEVRTRSGLFKKVLAGVGADKDGIYLSTGLASELPDLEDRVRVQPLPSSPRVEPDGECYPMGFLELEREQ